MNVPRVFTPVTTSATTLLAPTLAAADQDTP